MVDIERGNHRRSIKLASMPVAGVAESWLRLSNRACGWVEIARITTSCPCLSVRLAERKIAPRQSVDVIVQIDLSSEPEFEGGLCPEVRFFGPDGEELFAWVLDVNVVAAAQSATRFPAVPQQRNAWRFSIPSLSKGVFHDS